jgi:flagellar motor switch protein FliG
LKQAPKAAAVEGRSRLAGIINGLDAPEAEDAMRALEQASPKEAAIVKAMLFSFNDLPRLSERARALLFDRASIDIVVMALRGTDAEFRDTVLSSMPSRGRRLVDRRAQFRRECAASGHRQGAQGHRRNRARHGEPQ